MDYSLPTYFEIAAPEGDFGYWGSKLNVPMATFNTLLLITSSVTMVMSWASLKLEQFDKYKMYLGITILCGLAFLVVKYFEYTSKFDHGIYPSSALLWVYILYTNRTARLHIIGGLLVLIFFWSKQSDKME